ncbi:hypothetical protein [Halomonas daqiaonensis]|uniref:Uncharacterized protein n=1 Tax=Halomonas daqiaonensis TaxID=650850 RepID=A0A1H7RZ15_9GAMM|nr:hypothetical protein [Halomonas daqiaonensis]SEL65465.1 hypothetical protein SAMN04488129_11385 [Halomonas daqiaonensis]
MKNKLLITVCGLAFSATAMADLRISEIPGARFTEAQAVTSQEWHRVSEINGLQLPVTAKHASKDGRLLEFNAGGARYQIARADVVVVGERLVTSACDTAPITIASDSRSASVRGAGEACD